MQTGLGCRFPCWFDGDIFGGTFPNWFSFYRSTSPGPWGSWICFEMIVLFYLLFLPYVSFENNLFAIYYHLVIVPIARWTMSVKRWPLRVWTNVSTGYRRSNWPLLPSKVAPRQRMEEVLLLLFRRMEFQDSSTARPAWMCWRTFKLVSSSPPLGQRILSTSSGDTSFVIHSRKCPRRPWSEPVAVYSLVIDWFSFKLLRSVRIRLPFSPPVNVPPGLRGKFTWGQRGMRFRIPLYVQED